MWRARAGKDGRSSGESDEVLAGAIEHFLVKTADGIFSEVRRLAVCVGGCRVFVLLVDEDGVGIAFDAVRDVADTAGLSARGFGELTQDFGDLFPVFRRELHSNSKADHGEKVPSCCILKSCAETGDRAIRNQS